MVTMRLSCTVSEIQPQRYWGHELDLLVPCDVIGHVTVGLGICGFLLVVHCNHMSILRRYGDTEPQILLGHDFDLLAPRPNVHMYVASMLDRRRTSTSTMC